MTPGPTPGRGGGASPPDPAPGRGAGAAATPLYDWPELRDALDAFWAALSPRLAKIGLDPAPALDRARAPGALWADPDLLLGQPCGLAHVAGEARATRIICAPVYEAEGCGPGRLGAVALVRRGASGAGAPSLQDLRGLRIAACGAPSPAAWALLLDEMGAEGVGEALWTATPREALVAAAEGRADVAAVDALSWDMARRFEPAAAELAPAAWTEQAPAPPFVTSALRPSGDRARIRAALVETLADPETASIRAELRLARIVALADTDYDPLRRLAAGLRAAAAARPDLAPG